MKISASPLFLSTCCAVALTLMSCDKPSSRYEVDWYRLPVKVKADGVETAISVYQSPEFTLLIPMKSKALGEVYYVVRPPNSVMFVLPVSKFFTIEKNQAIQLQRGFGSEVITKFHSPTSIKDPKPHFDQNLLTFTDLDGEKISIDGLILNGESQEEAWGSHWWDRK